MNDDLSAGGGLLTVPGTNAPVLTVSEVSGALKRSVEQAFSFVRVRGEISGCKRHSSGHVYLALKDADAIMDAVCWRGVAGRLALRPEDGMEVIATGKLTTYPGRSKYQMVIDQMELAGEGALLKLLDDRRKKLAAEGLFDPARKKPLPYLPTVIGVITSPTGAVIRDILHRLADRFPRRVLLWPVAVQGDGAAAQIAAAIVGFNRIEPGGSVPRPDVLIVARGGGSLDDLMAFNDEMVVRAAAASRIPLISAVGHETDTTLIDYAADRRAPTPTAAAEMAVPVRLDLLAQVRDLGGRLDLGIGRFFAAQNLRLDGLVRGLPDPVGLIETATQRLDDRAERLALGIEAVLRDRAARLAETAARLPHPRHHLAEAARHLGREGDRLTPALTRMVARSGERLNEIGGRLRNLPMHDHLARRVDLVAAAGHRLDHGGRQVLTQAADRLDRLGQVLESLSPYKVLERGYAVVEDRAGQPLGPEAIVAGQALSLRFHQARIDAWAESGPRPLDGGSAGAVAGAAPKTVSKKRKTPPPEQETLF